MTDIALKAIAGGWFDLSVAANDLEKDEGLRTSIIISLFTDRRVSLAELPVGETDQRGWWGDTLSEAGDQVGSRLWLLDREKLDEKIIPKAEEYTKEALQWLIDDRVCKFVEVTATVEQPDLLKLSVVLKKAAGEQLNYEFQKAWDAETKR